MIGMTCAASGSITIPTVPIGNPGNAPDFTGYGSVAYEYNIGANEVTIGQYAAFLNAVAATDTFGLYNGNMPDPLGGITRSGSMRLSFSKVGQHNSTFPRESLFRKVRKNQYVIGSGRCDAGGEARPPAVDHGVGWHGNRSRLPAAHGQVELKKVRTAVMSAKLTARLPSASPGHEEGTLKKTRALPESVPRLSSP